MSSFILSRVRLLCTLFTFILLFIESAALAESDIPKHNVEQADDVLERNQTKQKPYIFRCDGTNAHFFDSWRDAGILGYKAIYDENICDEGTLIKNEVHTMPKVRQILRSPFGKNSELFYALGVPFVIGVTALVSLIGIYILSLLDRRKNVQVMRARCEQCSTEIVIDAFMQEDGAFFCPSCGSSQIIQLVNQEIVLHTHIGQDG